MKRLIAVSATIIGLLAVAVATAGTAAAHGVEPPGVESPAAVANQFSVTADLAVVSGYDPDARAGTYPQRPQACAPPYSFTGCGGLDLNLTFTDLDVFPRPTTCYPGPTPGTGWCEAGFFSGTATVHRTFGCATRSGNRVPPFDARVTTEERFFGPLRQFFLVPLQLDEAHVNIRSMLSWAHPGHCPRGLQAAQWAIAYEDVVVTLDSWHYPAWSWELDDADEWRSDSLGHGGGRRPVSGLYRHPGR